jgi:hypothetical protein
VFIYIYIYIYRERERERERAREGRLGGREGGNESASYICILMLMHVYPYVAVHSVELRQSLSLMIIP